MMRIAIGAALVLVAALAGCGDNAIAPADAQPGIDAQPGVDAPPSCTATFAGNFAQTTSSPLNCATPTVDASTHDTLLSLSLAATRLAIPLAISIDLGAAPAPGEYSSETVQQWSAYAYAHDLTGAGGACQYSAGAAATPHGSFTLSLSAISGATAHGTLAITLYVLAFVSTQCGPGDNELVTIDF